MRRSATRVRTAASKRLADDWEAVARILDAIHATGFVLPLPLRRPNTGDLNAEELAHYREQLGVLGGLIENVFVAEGIAAKPSEEARANHVARVRNLAAELVEALDSPLTLGLLHSAYIARQLDPSEGLEISRLRDDLTRLTELAKAELELGSERQRYLVSRPTGGFSSFTPVGARMWMMERVFRDDIAQSESWKPELRNSKTNGIDEFTAFAVAVCDAKGINLEPASFQRAYRRSWSRTKPKK